MSTTNNASKIDSAKPFVALTFDDGPSEYTTQILDTLHRYGGQVTFFVTGNKVNEHKGKILRATAMDCEIICHAWDHSDLTKLSSRKIKKQLYDTIAAIASLTGKVSLMFRPPYGNSNEKVEKVARKLGLSIVNWSLDTNDWETQSAEDTYNCIIDNMKSGDIVLCHDVYESTALAMSRLIPRFLAEGWQFVTVSELLHHKHGELEPGKLYTS